MSSEREVSFMSCNGIVSSLLELGYYVTFIDMGEDVAQVLYEIKPDVVFNGLHGTYGEDGCLPGLLEIMKIPYTSCGVLASSICFNKKKTLDIFKSNNIKIAEFISVSKSDGVKTDPMPRPYVIKPYAEGSSIGVEVVFEEDDFDFASYEFQYGDILVEKYIKGREIQIAVLNGKALGTLEISLLKGKRFYDYETKYTEGFAEHICPANLSNDALNRAMKIAEKIVNIMGADGMVRVELIYSDAEDDFYALELNTHPGMTPLSICPEIAQKQHGISYTELVSKILLGALPR
jgi:D-alanine-D-alanine ligase